MATRKPASETELINRWLKADAARQAAEEALEKHFKPLVEEALRSRDVAAATTIAHRMPDCVSRVFMLDTIRQASKGQWPGDLDTADTDASESAEVAPPVRTRRPRTAASVTARSLPQGIYLITDPVYVAPDDVWQAWIDSNDLSQPGVLDIDGHAALVWPTVIGDGVFPVHVGGVAAGSAAADSGMLAAVPGAVVLQDPVMQQTWKDLADREVGAVVEIRGGPVEHDGETGVMRAGELVVGELTD